MMPQTRAGTRTPAWPGSRGRGLPETGLAALSPIAIAAHGMWPISMARARGLEREKNKLETNKLSRATRMRQAWGSSERPSK